MDTESGDARFGKIPLSSMGPYPEPGYTGVFDLIFAELSECDATEPEALMLNAPISKPIPRHPALTRDVRPLLDQSSQGDDQSTPCGL